MPTLKPYYDAALAADAEVQSIMSQIDAAFTEGTPEGKEKALGLRETLDKAKANAKAANELYVSMRDASLVSDNAAANFTAPPDPARDAEDEKSKKTMNRAAFDALKPAEKMKFAKAGGQVVD